MFFGTPCQYLKNYFSNYAILVFLSKYEKSFIYAGEKINYLEY